MTDARQSVNRAERVRRLAIALSALSQSGLVYTTNEYDLDRYRKLGALAAELLGAVTAEPAAHWELELGRDHGYATPKVDVRGALVDEHERILLMRERSDGRWSLPGGWADPLDTPSRAVEREILEETGYRRARSNWSGAGIGTPRGTARGCRSRSTSCFSSARRPVTSGRPDALETLDVGWFGIDELPDLSLGRVNVRQLGRVLAHRRDLLLPTEFD